MCGRCLPRLTEWCTPTSSACSRWVLLGCRDQQRFAEARVSEGTVFADIKCVQQVGGDQLLCCPKCSRHVPLLCQQHSTAATLLRARHSGLCATRLQAMRRHRIGPHHFAGSTGAAGREWIGCQHDLEPAACRPAQRQGACVHRLRCHRLL